MNVVWICVHVYSKYWFVFSWKYLMHFKIKFYLRLSVFWWFWPQIKWCKWKCSSLVLFLLVICFHYPSLWTWPQFRKNNTNNLIFMGFYSARYTCYFMQFQTNRLPIPILCYSPFLGYPNIPLFNIYFDMYRTPYILLITFIV